MAPCNEPGTARTARASDGLEAFKLLCSLYCPSGEVPLATFACCSGQAGSHETRGLGLLT